MAFFDPTRASYRANPYPSLARLREEDPVHRSPALQAWVTTRFGDCAEVLRDNTRFTADPTRTEGPRADAITVHRATVPLGSAATLSNTSAQAHAALRRVVNPCFTPAAVRKAAPRISSLVEDFLDDLPLGEPFDFMGRFANPLPKRVMLGLMGFPVADAERMQHCLAVLEVTRSNPRAGNVSAARAAQTELEASLERRLADEQPEGSVLGALAHAHTGGMSIDTVVSVAAHIATVGSDPAAGAIANSMVAIAGHPSSVGELRRVRPRMRMAAHELLRYDSPTHLVPRFAVADTELGGRRIRRGDVVLAMVGAANRDPAAFPKPDELNLERDARRQLGFGQGDHICLGAPLALAILEAALGGLLDRFARIELVAPPDYCATVELRIPDRLILRCT